MGKTFLLVLLAFTLHQSMSYAQDAAQQTAPPEFIKASFSNNTADTTISDGLGTSITIYSLIIGIYALYWFKQKT